MFCAVKTVQDLHILVADKQILGECTFNGVQEGSAVIRIDFGCGRTVGSINAHGDFQKGFYFHD